MGNIIIPNTDLGELFPLGLGSVKAGNDWDKDQTFRMFDAFVENGGNVLDTARIYSLFSKSEEYIGAWAKETKKRDKVIIIGKGGHPAPTEKGMDMHAFRLSREEMTSDLDTSLELMKLDHFDIYLYHRDDEKRSVEELVDTMEGFVKAGKIRYYGCSNWSTARMREVMDYCKSNGKRGFVMNQAHFNAATDFMNPWFDDTIVAMDEEMKVFHKENPEILATAFSSIALGFFEQYINGGEEAVKQKSYLTDKNIQVANLLNQVAKENHLTLLQATLLFFKTIDFTCLPLFGARDEKSLLEAMEVFR